MRDNIKDVKLTDLGSAGDFRPGDLVMFRPLATCHEKLMTRVADLEIESSSRLRQALADYIDGGGNANSVSDIVGSQRLFISARTGRLKSYMEIS